MYFHWPSAEETANNSRTREAVENIEIRVLSVTWSRSNKDSPSKMNNKMTFAAHETRERVAEMTSGIHVSVSSDMKFLTAMVSVISVRNHRDFGRCEG